MSSLNSGRVSTRCLSWIVAVLLAVPLAFPMVAMAQGNKGKKNAPDSEKITGKVQEIEKKGKAATLTVEKEGGGTMEVLLTPKTRLAINAKGDSSFFQAKTYVASEKVIMANNELFGHEFTIYVGNTPPASFQRDAGGGEWYHLSGQLVGADKESVTINCGTNGSRRVAFEEGVPLEVSVVSSNLDLIAEGAEIELEGMTRNGKFLPAKVSVNLDRQLTPDDLHPEKKPAKAKTPVAKGAKKGAKKGTDAADSEDSDPFGVLGKKDDKPAPPKDGDKSP